VHSHRLLVDTIFCVLVTGCAWRLVPRDLAPWNTAYKVFAAWTADGTWARVHDELRDRVRVAEGRDPHPSEAVLDSQSVRTHQGGEQIGYDAGKRVRGRKRHLLVDTGRAAVTCPGAFGLGAGRARCPLGARRYPGTVSAAGAGVGVARGLRVAICCVVPEIATRRCTQPPPPRFVYEALTDPDRDPYRVWLILHDDEQRPSIAESVEPNLVVWTSIWKWRPDARIRFELDSAGGGSTELRWRLSVDEPVPDHETTVAMRRRVDELINANLRRVFGQ
jgi:transposase